MELITKTNQLNIQEDIIKRKRKGNYDNNIYTFDIEVCSLFKLHDKWSIFDKSIKDYSGVEKCSVPYIAMFGVNDHVYYFRDFMFFGDILEKLSSNIRKYIFIHNLSYEFQFLLNIIEEKNWTVSKMCSRDIRKPISFYIPEINIEFRCTYMLTNMSLDFASKIYTNIKKKTGQLDYNQMFSPYTHLNDDELEYCEFDILCLYEIVKYYRDQKYGCKLANIPLTATGEVRKQIKQVIDYWYILKRWERVPSRKMYLIYMLCFAGGYTHANMLHSGVIMHNVSSRDIASSYPSCFFEKFPQEDFRFCPVEEYMSQPDDYAYIVNVEFTDVECITYNTYIQKSKIVNAHVSNVIYDNGRLVKSDGTFEMFLTEIDFELIKKCYKGKFKIIECWKAFKNFLDKRILKFILQMYKFKTTLKKEVQTPEEEVLYRTAKSNINSCYGVCVSNILKSSSDFKNGQWQRFSFSDEFVDSKIDEAKHSWSTLFEYTTGLYVTSFARKNLFSCILKMDRDVIYCDTDSIKFIGNHDDIFDKFNESVIERYNKVIEHYPNDFTISDFQPIDPEGNKHTLGVFEIENDHDIKSFKTLGAKKYCYELDDGLHLTLSGVNKKSGVEALKGDINNFRNGFEFDYESAGKLIHYYNDEQPEITYEDRDGNIYTSDLKYGIVLQPTTYKIGTTLEYEMLLYEIQIEESEVEYNGENDY